MKIISENVRYHREWNTLMLSFFILSFVIIGGMCIFITSYNGYQSQGFVFGVVCMAIGYIMSLSVPLINKFRHNTFEVYDDRFVPIRASFREFLSKKRNQVLYSSVKKVVVIENYPGRKVRVNKNYETLKIVLAYTDDGKVHRIDNSLIRKEVVNQFIDVLRRYTGRSDTIEWINKK